jgi:hypothetical protein
VNSASPLPRWLPVALFSAFAIGVAISSWQVAAYSGSVFHRPPDLRVVLDRDLQSFADPRPSLRTARGLSEDPRFAIYSEGRRRGSFYVYPPLAAAIYRPLANLDEKKAYGALSAVNRLILAAIVALLVSLASYGLAWSWKRVAAVVVVAACFHPLLRAVQLNQSTLQVTLLLGIVWVSLQRGRGVPAAVALALATAIKPQLVLILPFVLLAEPRVAIWTAGVGGVLALLSLAYAGVANHITYVTEILPSFSTGYAFFPNQSFNGFFNRLLLDVPLDAFKLAPASPEVRGLTAAFGLLVYAGALAIAWRNRGRKDVALPVFGLGWLVATLISPVAWEHHYAPALFLFAWLYREYAVDGSSPPPAILPAVAAGWILMASYFDVMALDATAARLLASYVFFGALLLAGAMAAMLVSRRVS